jgi:hypothetical protein
MIDGSGVRGHGICPERGQLRQFSMVTHLKKLVSLGSPRNSMLFMGIESVLLSDSVILLHDNA